MIGVLFVALFQATAGQPAPAAPGAAPAAATAPAATENESARDGRSREAQDRQKLVCRSETVLGSRLPVRRCTSAADDEAEGANARAWIDRMQSQVPTKITD